MGDLHVNTYPSKEGKTCARLVLRAEKTQRLSLNCPLFAGMTVELQSEKHVRFNSLDLDQKPAAFLLKFNSKPEAMEVLEAIKKCQKLIA